MSIFSSILDKIFHHAQTSSGQAGAGPSAQTTGQQSAGVAAGPQSQARAASEAARQQTSFGAATGASATLQGVDVEAVLTQLASKKGGGGNWRTSVVDLLKVLDLDSGLDARKQLATELNVSENVSPTELWATLERSAITGKGELTGTYERSTTPSTTG